MNSAAYIQGVVSADRSITTDPFFVTGDWLRSVLTVWRRDDCVLCGKPFEVGERVRWLHPDYPGEGAGYRVVHADCVDAPLWPQRRPVGRRGH